MSSTPYLDKLFDISMRLNKASVYCSSNPLLMRQLERAICSINEHLFDVRCQRAMGKDADCLELQARTALSFFRHMFKDMTVIFEKEEEADKKAEEEERKMVANQEKTVSNDADLTSCLITLSSKLLEMFSTVQKELGEITEVLRKKPEESEETRHEVIRADYQEEIRRLKRARCRLSRKNSKLTEENEELMKENWELKAEKVDEFSKQFGSLQMNAELVAKCQAAMAEQQVLKKKIPYMSDTSRIDRHTVLVGDSDSCRLVRRHHRGHVVHQCLFHSVILFHGYRGFYRF
uniref:RH1 domain-containing protein n=1 Tax=Caenorhabditis tropicalis TaxID=1561998 RepID=A0A1I7UH61_9PELO